MDPNPHRVRDGGARESPWLSASVDLSDYLRELILFIDAKGRIQSGAGGLGHTLGYGSGEQAGTHIAEHIHPDDMARVLEMIEWARSTEPPFYQRVTARARHSDGRWIPFRSEVMSAEPPLVGVVLRCRPLDDDDAEYVQGDERFTSLADIVPVGILAADVRGFVVFANEPASALLGLDADELHGHGWERCLTDDGATEVAKVATLIVKGEGVGRERVVVEVERSGEQRFLHLTLVRLGTRDRPTGWLATFEDVTDRQRAAANLLRQATHDHLTGLPNRLLLEDRLEQAAARATRSDGSLTVMFADLEEFKAINDVHGHAAGDAVLMEVARRLADNLREADTLVRLGGDEFVAVCEGLDAQQIEGLLQRLRAAVAEPLQVGESTVRLGVSLGVVTVDARSGASTSPDELLARADQAMYHDKRVRQKDA